MELATKLFRPKSVVFSGGPAYAFLTNPPYPVITDLVSGTAGENYKIPRRRLEEIRVGDILVFRDGGRKDVIQALADAQLGAEAPTIRERRRGGTRRLRESGLDETNSDERTGGGELSRTLQTVRSWLTDDSMIGPADKSDLEAIAYAAGNQKLLEDVSDIWQAIHILPARRASECRNASLPNIALKNFLSDLDSCRRTDPN